MSGDLPPLLYNNPVYEAELGIKAVSLWLEFIGKSYFVF
jgi:hypothetical protein